MYLLTPALRRRFWVAPPTALAVALPWWVFSWYHFGSAIPTSSGDQDAAEVVRRRDLRQRLVEDVACGHDAAAVPRPRARGGRAAHRSVPVGARRARPAARRALAAGGAGARRARGLRGVLPARGSAVPLVLRVVDGRPRRDRRVRDRRSSCDRSSPATVAGTSPARGPGRSPRRSPSAPSCPSAASVVPWTHPVIFGNWALPEQYMAVGAAGRRAWSATPRSKSPPEIGTAAYALRLLGRRRVLRPGTDAAPDREADRRGGAGDALPAGGQLLPAGPKPATTACRIPVSLVPRRFSAGPA